MTLATVASPFDVLGELPTGTTVLEASAGTGKTFTIAALATRYVAEGHARLPDLMLVTFGRAATQELRERVRERLVGTARALADPAAARAGADPLDALLAAGPDAEVAARRARLTAALAHFEAATIATTHQFCAQMLGELGMSGDAEPGTQFVERIDDLVAEVVDDFYLRKWAAAGATPPELTRQQALGIARLAVNDGQARLEPAAAPAGSEAEVRVRFAAAVRAEVDRRKRVLRLSGYDDLLTRLAGALADPDRGPAATARLRTRYRVVLVDEFQDTDPVQWDILRRAFHGHATLVLIGDPKQAIYAFRGADVVSYLDAARDAGAHATLATNWRSDAALLGALDVVQGGAALGDPRIVVRPVASAHPERRLRGAPAGAPLRLRVVPRTGLPAVKGGLAATGPAREHVAEDLAADVSALLTSGAELTRQGGEPDGWRPLVPGDVAVLVRTNAQAALVRDALAGAGVPAVLTGTSSVFGTAAAGDWLTLLEGLEQPHRAVRVRAAALTPFVGRTVVELDEGGDPLVDEVGGSLREWASVFAGRGVAALLEAVTHGTGLTGRLLGAADGERRLTDLRHIGQALHAASVEGHLGLTALAEWLRRRTAEAAEETGLERSRRLETDADAVQVVTVHRSKGLEFPVVYLPFGWDRFVPKADLLLLHDDDGHRVLDVGGGRGPGRRAREVRHRLEDGGEDLRLLYVALTRARCQVVAWWAPTPNTGASALHRLLFGRPAPGVTPDGTYPVREDAPALAHLAPLASELVAVEPVNRWEAAQRWAPPAGPAAALDRARFARRLDGAWRRTSYSSLTAGAHAHHGAGVGSEPETPLRDDEPELGTAVEPAGPDESGAGDLPSPMADLPADALFGTLVHAVLEATDPTAPDLLAELTARAAEQLALHPDPRLEPGPLAAALLPALRTPLGPLADGASLSDLDPADRLPELDFELPLAGGDAARGGELRLGDLARVLRAGLAPGDPMRRLADSLEAEPLAGQSLRGYLNGSIDAVLRIRSAAGGLDDVSYLVVDYKTNWLGGFTAAGAEPLTTRHYRQAALATAMVAANYPLQALLYAVAVHRFLRWRQPGYDPERHLGGVLYLYLRGMAGPGTPAEDGVPCGVFSWRPPAALVVRLSAVLDAGRVVP